ncbi:MAG: ABC transporter permease [Candidatus Asgardarchaeia archaeon]
MIISVGLIIGGLGIFIVASQTIIQRRWEFGVLRSIGFGRWDITKIIFSEALLISVTAFILAIIDLPFSLQVAVEASAAASGVLHLEYVFPWDALVTYFVIVILLALLGAAKPAYSITKENIVAILRREQANYCLIYYFLFYVTILSYLLIFHFLVLSMYFLMCITSLENENCNVIKLIRCVLCTRVTKKLYGR